MADSWEEEPRRTRGTLHTTLPHSLETGLRTTPGPWLAAPSILLSQPTTMLGLQAHVRTSLFLYVRFGDSDSGLRV